MTKVRLLAAVALIILAGASSSSAQSSLGWSFYYNGFDDSRTSPPDCQGHCGAGCGNAFDACSPTGSWFDIIWDPSPDGYWGEPVQLTEAQLTADWWESQCIYEDVIPAWTVVNRIGQFQAAFRFTFHGFFHSGCLLHDQVCPEEGWWWCLFIPVCGPPGDGHFQDWGYDAITTGNFIMDSYYYPGC